MLYLYYMYYCFSYPVVHLGLYTSDFCCLLLSKARSDRGNRGGRGRGGEYVYMHVYVD